MLGVLRRRKQRDAGEAGVAPYGMPSEDTKYPTAVTVVVFDFIEKTTT